MPDAIPLTIDSTVLQTESPRSAERNPLLPAFPGYDTLHEIGRGGMGVVLKARQTAVNRLVALKMILPGSLPSGTEIARFNLEAIATANLRHPNIVRVYEVGEQDGCPFFTMDFIDGPSLSKKLQDGPLSGKNAARMLLPLTQAIQHAHENQLLHRDLKPSNILLDGEDRPFVADFGLVKQIGTDSGQTRTGAILGTPSYMAPEQALGTKEITASVDVYGLGAILYEMLTGRPPFRAESPMETVRQVIDNLPPPPRLLNPNIEKDIETICLKCLEKDPARRYESAASLAADLQRFLSGESISARSLNMRERIGHLLERSQYDVEFSEYGVMLYWFAVTMLIAQTVTTLALEAKNLQLGLISNLCLLFADAVIFWQFRRKSGSLLPNTPAERLMWSVWIGYLLACSTYSDFFRQKHTMLWFFDAENYLGYAAITGLAFFSLGSSYWGWCYGFGVAFLALGFVMLIDMRWAPLEFGLLWAFVLVCIGTRLRRLGRTASAEIS